MRILKIRLFEKLMEVIKIIFYCWLKSKSQFKIMLKDLSVELIDFIIIKIIRINGEHICLIFSK